MTLWSKIPVLLTLAALCAAAASAASIYTSRDANGNLVFSDVPVTGAEVLEVRQVEVAKGPCCRVEKRGSDDDVVLVGVSECYGPVEFSFRLDEATNVASDRGRSFSALIPARKNRDLVRLRQANRQRRYSYRFTHSLVLGDSAARHLPEQPYLLPVPTGERFRFSQVFGGKATHTHPQSLYAVDIPMPQGTPIHAARGGVIMEVANDFLTGGTGSQFWEKANFIRILHDDGTMAVYAHLRAESIQYAAGTRVERGQIIAESGNTGYSSGPHLHFVVQQNVAQELRSVPFEFAGPDGRPYTPEQGMVVHR